MTRIVDIAWNTVYCGPDTLARALGVPILPDVDLDDEASLALQDELEQYTREDLERIGNARSLLGAQDGDWTSLSRRLLTQWGGCPPLPTGEHRSHLLRAGALVEHVERCSMGHSPTGAYDCIGAAADPWDETPTEEGSIAAWASMFAGPVGAIFERRPGRHGYFVADGLQAERRTAESASELARRLHHWLQSWDWAELMLLPRETSGVPAPRTSALSGRPWCISVSKVMSDRDLKIGVTLVVEAPTAVAMTAEVPDGFSARVLRSRLEGVEAHLLVGDTDDVLAEVLGLLSHLQVHPRSVELERRTLSTAESAHTRAYVARSRARRASRWVLTHCLKCERPLTDAISAGRGYGPDCWKTLTRHAVVDETADARFYAAAPAAAWLVEVTDRLVDRVLRQVRRRREVGLRAAARVAGRAR